jgi:hypothetical protein
MAGIVPAMEDCVLPGSIPNLSLFPVGMPEIAVPARPTWCRVGKKSIGMSLVKRILGVSEDHMDTQSRPSVHPSFIDEAKNTSAKEELVKSIAYLSVICASILIGSFLLLYPGSVCAESIAKDQVNIRSGPSLKSSVIYLAPLGYVQAPCFRD